MDLCILELRLLTLEEFVNMVRFRNDLPVEPETMDRYRITSVKGELKLCIIRAKPKDTGVFKCRIENEVGWTSCDCKVVVKGMI